MRYHDAVHQVTDKDTIHIMTDLQNEDLTTSDDTAGSSAVATTSKPDAEDQQPQQSQPQQAQLQQSQPQQPDDVFAQKKVPLALRIYGVLAITGGVITLLLIAIVLLLVRGLSFQGIFADVSISTWVLTIVLLVTLVVLTGGFVVFGIRLLRNKRKWAAATSNFLIVVDIIALLCDTMLSGIGRDTVLFGITLVMLIALTSYLDPTLAQERELQIKLRKLDDKERAEEGTLGLDETGKGYISLNFFNLFWIFVVCSIIGLILETAQHMIIVDPGVYQDRAGLLIGPFSPIYGVGAVLMTLVLNRFYKAPFPVIFLLAAIIGGAFEFFVSWFMENAFGIIAWDYTGRFLSIGGRTCGIFMCAWGVLGLVWIKLLLPWTLKLVNRIPWNWRYSLTTVCSLLMLVDCVMTLQSLDCWYEREAGQLPTTPVEEFYADHFDDTYMADRFQSMSINPEDAARADS